MIIKSFEIENYRSLKKIKIDNFDSTTVFYGLNNAGKSNILNALSLIFKKKSKLSTETQTLSELENFYSGVLPDFGNNYFNNTAEKIKFLVSIEVESIELDIDSSISSLFPKKGRYTFTFIGEINKQEPAEYNYSEIKITEVNLGSKKIYEQGAKGFFFFPTIDKPRKNQSLLNDSFTKLIDVFNDCVYVIPSERDMLETISPGERYQSELKNARDYIVSGEKDKALLILESLSKKSEGIPDSSEVNSRSFKKFLYSLYLSPQKYHLFEVINNTFNGEPFSFGSISFANEKDILDVMISEDSFRLPIKHLGSGVTQSLFIITSIICSKSKIICIEELEQNLSPSLQFQILAKLQELVKKGQFDQLILSSHTSVYSKTKLGSIYLLEKSNGETLINQIEKKKPSNKLKKHFVQSNFPPGTYTETEYEQFQKIMLPNRTFN